MGTRVPGGGYERRPPSKGGAPLSVLVVEDSRTQAVRLRVDLESQDFRVLVTGNGEEALAVARQERPDIILSDVLMPDMDGFRLCREVHMDESLRHIPVVLRTAAFLSPEDREFALRLGARGYIDKEMGREELADLLTRLAYEERQGAGRNVEDEQFHGDYQDRLLTRLVEEAARLEQTNEELRESRAQLQAILDHSPVFIYVKDLDGTYLVTNRHFSTLGLEPESIVGRKDSDLFDPEQAERLVANDQAVVREKKPVETEEVLTGPGGERILLSTKFPLLDVDDRLTAIAGVSIDITERTQLERRLRHAERMEAVGRLASGVAHDFNNLLTIISNYAAFVAEDMPEEDARRVDLEQVQDAANRGANLVRQLLAFGARKSSGGIAELNLNSAIGEIESLLRVSVGSAVNVGLKLGSGVPQVAIDPTNVDQIVLNLATNARDAMPEGGSLEIETRPVVLREATAVGDVELAPGIYAELSVRDTGIGMDPETVRKVFEPFFTLKEAGRGTGLGLATIHGIVRDLGGSIGIRSEPGRGTTFTIWLPAATGEVPPVAQEEAQERSVPSTPTILVVDDEAAIRTIVRRTLERAGYEVLVASSGEDALEIYGRERHRLHLVLSDIRMPNGISGTVLAEKLRAIDPSLPILHMSGSEVSADAILKPFTTRELLDSVDEALRTSEVRLDER